MTLSASEEQSGGFVRDQDGRLSIAQGGGYSEVTFSTTTAQAVATTDVSQFKLASVQITSQGTSSLIAFQGSNDNVNWVAVAGFPPSAQGTATTASSGTGVYAVPLLFRYFRLNVTGISAGTTAGTIELYSSPGPQVLNTNGGGILVVTGGSPLQSLTNASAVSNGTTLDNTAARLSHTLTVVTSAGVSAGVVTLEVSADNSNWFLTTTTVTTNAASTTFAVALANFPARYVRAAITTSITGGTISAWVASAG